jgi:hypothetical protein
MNKKNQTSTIKVCIEENHSVEISFGTQTVRITMTGNDDGIMEYNNLEYNLHEGLIMQDGVHLYNSPSY